jgi:hypothetical protein
VGGWSSLIPKVIEIQRENILERKKKCLSIPKRGWLEREK